MRVHSLGGKKKALPPNTDTELLECTSTPLDPSTDHSCSNRALPTPLDQLGFNIDFVRPRWLDLAGPLGPAAPFSFLVAESLQST